MSHVPRPGIRLHTGAALLVGAAVVGVALGGCTVVSAVRKAEATVHSNSSVIDLFTSNLKAGQPASFEATYATTGSSPSKIVYAVRPPGELAFSDTSSAASTSSGGTSNFQLIVNLGGNYLCTESGHWSCERLAKAGAPVERALLGFYTPSHWVSFLRGFSLAAGFAGDKISTSSTTVNGFAMQCVDFVASGVAGTSRICTTAAHLLGYVQIASDSTGFEITSYTASPPGSLFDLPPGATVTTPKPAAQ
jgi:hypothetical protein